MVVPEAAYAVQGTYRGIIVYQGGRSQQRCSATGAFATVFLLRLQSAPLSCIGVPMGAPGLSKPDQDASCVT
jgi:hypothetical protein